MYRGRAVIGGGKATKRLDALDGSIAGVLREYAALRDILTDLDKRVGEIESRINPPRV